MRFISKICTRWVSGLTLLVSSTIVNGQNIHISHCLEACPTGDDDNEIVVRHLYASQINRSTGIVDWVAYRVLPDAIGVASLLPRYWKQDELFPDSRLLEVGLNISTIEQPDLHDAQDKDYRVNEFVLSSDNKGRLAPMTSFADTPYWDDLNYSSNMASLPSDLRLGAWSRLDQAINELSSTDGPIYVVSGPIYKTGEFDSVKRYEEPPESYFKVVATEKAYASFTFAVELPIHAEYCSQVETIDEIQKSSGLQIFPYMRSVLQPDLYGRLRCEQQFESFQDRNN